jgi:hypothetical protein
MSSEKPNQIHQTGDIREPGKSFDDEEFWCEQKNNWVKDEDCRTYQHFGDCSFGDVGLNTA